MGGMLVCFGPLPTKPRGGPKKVVGSAQTKVVEMHQMGVDPTQSELSQTERKSGFEVKQMK